MLVGHVSNLRTSTVLVQSKSGNAVPSNGEDPIFTSGDRCFS